MPEPAFLSEYTAGSAAWQFSQACRAQFAKRPKHKEGNRECKTKSQDPQHSPPFRRFREA
eukprot:2931957-Amphidinium_carterae.1